MNKVVCPDCGVRMVECRRYRLEPLAEFMRMTMSATCIEVRISGKSQQHALCHGITRRIVDRVAAELKEHPATIWPEVVQHDIEDASKTCVECGQSFLPSQPRQKFCTRLCGRRNRDRRYQHNRYHSDLVHRARKLAAATDYKREARRGINAQRRRWVAENVEAVRAKRRAHHEANKDFYNARRRARYQANRQAELETQRRYRERRKGEAA